ncbi:hypothetical protein GCM10010121_045950 [Streptomyces brasiliensis]|uniref:Uncharacterized protein n=1 Tax=Streptomyces brasiliensis TaxID=1954 RepID=A0A917KV28_9ACTN|nr:hypothetical protein GCM10010121_045950 [Streptomyces brasiliensis]
MSALADDWHTYAMYVNTYADRRQCERPAHRGGSRLRAYDRRLTHRRSAAEVREGAK